MEGHFEQITQIQGALVAGNLPTARSHAEVLAHGLTNRTHPAGWEQDLAVVRRSAWRVVRAQSLAQAAEGVARAAGACGNCHLANRVEVVSVDPEGPDKTSAPLGDFMLRHRWATEQLWSGLIGPSESAWRAGANLLAEMGLFPSDPNVSITPEMRALADELSNLEHEALGISSHEARVAYYGELLGACARCHRLFLDQVD